jgi:hypothetical protein
MYYISTKKQLQDNYGMENCGRRFTRMNDTSQMSDDKVPKISRIRPLLSRHLLRKPQSIVVF